MPKNKNETSSPKRDTKLIMLRAKTESIFEQVQRIYDISSDIHTNASIKETFLDESASIDLLRNEYKQTLDQYNTYVLDTIPDSQPEFSSLIAFDTLCNRIKRVRSDCVSRTLPRDDSVLQKHRPSLPPIELLSFSGEYRSWPLFYSSFKSAVHDNKSLTNVEKLYYLLGKLTGKARTVCTGISPCAENYPLILQALVDKYEDKRTLASAYLNQLFDFKAFQSASAANFELFTDTFISAVSALKNLNLDNLTDLILLHIALKKIDSDTVRDFELSCDSKIPTFDDLVVFMKTRSKVFERMSNLSVLKTNNRNQNNNRRSNNEPSPPKYQSYVSTTAHSTSKCLCTNFTHTHLFKCAEFNKLTPLERFDRVKKLNACVNCLSLSHKVSTPCTSDSTCRICKYKHHTMLHFNKQGTSASEASAAAVLVASSSVPSRTHTPTAHPAVAADVTTLCTTYERNLAASSASTARMVNKQTTVLLSTAQVLTYDCNGTQRTIRVLLDSGSQSHFITKECCNLLGLNHNDTDRTIVKGFGGTQRLIKSRPIDLTFFSRLDKNIKFTIPSLVVDQITDLLPTAVADTSVLSHLSGLPLADMNFGTPCKIDALIGASLFPHLLLPGIVHAPHGLPAPPALNTVLGYVIMGTIPAVPTLKSHTALVCCFAQEPTALDTLVKRFWELEEPPSAPPILHHAHAECEEFYKSTTSRDTATGRYTVALPFRNDVYTLGNSYESARRRFMSLERKLEASPNVRLAYDNVIKDYQDKGYISPAPPYDPSDPNPTYVIPHHGVVREDKTTTRLRIVMDASSKTSTGISLNDILHTGPNLQGNLFEIILKFRLYAVAISADCRQQFLQIVVRESDRRYQCILYRFNPQDPITMYQFNRVCFGLSSSPYHALRTVRQLIEDDGEKYPLASSIATTSLYMDDIVCSLPCQQDAILASQQLIALFKGAQWDLVKFNSNNSSVLDNLPASHRLPTDVEFDKCTHHKILGLHWSTDSDSLYFKITIPDDVTCTKRSILSCIARLWDIMGFVAPTVVYAKLLLKSLWQLKLDWDDTPPPPIIKMWKQFCAELPELNEMRIPRHIGVTEDCTISLIGFSDASSQAYGAVIYIHVTTASGVTVQLVCAKTKVAPTKPLSIARLELCGAVLMSKLMRTVLNNYSKIHPVNVYAFVDSMVSLYWIKSSPHRWQTFVANRVVQITDNISADQFYHVSGVENPADILSRGITPHKLINHPLWLHGPPWASLDPSQWPLRSLGDLSISDIPEEKVLTHTVCTSSNNDCILYEISLRLSSFNKLLHIIVFIYRFLKILPRRTGITPTVDDIIFAENKLLRALQNKYFVEDYNNLLNNKPCSPALNRLRPFIDDNGLIRVGGRLVNSTLDYTHVHPVILPRSDHIVNMIIDYYHVKQLHAGPELLMSVLRQRFWILSARRVIRQRIHKCNICFRLRPRPIYPLMADLPDSRVRQAAKAFTHTGCDYAGPIPYTPVRRRGVRSEKAYICVFTCLTTRAVHIEVATDLSTPSFLAALKRFLSRRGPVQFMYSDNGTNFKGADTYLRDLYKFLNDDYRLKLEQEYAESRITWKFICPRSPHWAGAWESMVKVIKVHLYRVIGQQLLSYEELCTVLTQIECLLNSRPLTVLSSDPAEPTALTPSHFLNTAPLLSLPAPEIQAEPVSLLHRHSLLDKLVQSFWNRWKSEYLHGLQVRQKWNLPSVPVVPGMVVVVIDDNSPPLYWPLAIVEKVHPSKDGIIRAVTVKTAKGTYVRPVVRLCPLPSQ